MFHNTKRKQIILVRHAKAIERDDWEGDDFDRPLSTGGEHANKIVANYLRLIGVKPDRIVASPSMRTRWTAQDIATKFHIDDVEYVRDLYNEDGFLARDSIDVHMQVVKSTKKSSQILMIVWHNNDLTEFAEYLSWDAVPSMKKWSVVVLSLPPETEWEDVEKWKLKFVYYLTPHFLRLEELV